MSLRQDMVCREFVEEVTNYLEGKLSEAEERWTDEHLAQCDHCRAYLAQMRATISALRGLAENDVDADLRARILAQLP
jgi:anti-sigma factor RsiW